MKTNYTHVISVKEMRLEVADNCPSELVQFLLTKFALTESDLYQVNGPVNLGRMMEVIEQIQRPDLCYPPFTPGLPLGFQEEYFSKQFAKKDTVPCIRLSPLHLLSRPSAPS